MLMLLLLSGIARLCVALYLLPTLREMRLLEIKNGKTMFHTPVCLKVKSGFHGDEMEVGQCYLNVPPHTLMRLRPKLDSDHDLKKRLYGSDNDPAKACSDSKSSQPMSEQKKQYLQKKFLQMMTGKGNKEQ